MRSLTVEFAGARRQSIVPIRCPAAGAPRARPRLHRVTRLTAGPDSVSGHERVRLHHAQDVESRRIFGQKHDRQHDFDRNGRIDRPAMR